MRDFSARFQRYTLAVTSFYAPSVAFTVLLACVLGSCGMAQQLSNAEYDRVKFDSELRRLVAICEQLGLAPEAEISRRWIAPERSDQLKLYLPVDLHDENVASREQASWAAHFNQARKRHADFLFDTAGRTCAANEQLAYSCVWQALRENPEHEQAQSVLGALAKSGTVRPRLTRARIAHPEFHWPANSYSKIQTPHFELTTRADPRESIALASRLEDFYALWTQVFFPLWAPPGLLESKLQGKTTPWPKHRGIEVFLLKDRADYLQTLAVAEGSIGLSVGYYNPGVQKSFFYPIEGSDRTLYHELTHQLLMEATRIGAQPKTGSQQGIWMLEGIAMYLESLSSRDNYWTVGGYESPWLQLARYRGLRDGFWPDWESFTKGNTEAWKSDPSISNLYAHAAGLTHVMLDSLDAAGREAYFRALVATYQGQMESASLLSLLGDTEEAAHTKYEDLLVLQDAQVAAIVASHTQPSELVLCASELSRDTWKMVGTLDRLEWLDVSFSNATSQDLAWLSTARTLQRLSLEGTAVTGQILELVAKLPKLEELDLTGCAISDEALLALRGQPTIQTLWLGQTQVSRQSLATLASMPKLRRCDITGSKIPAAAWSEFVKQHPILQ